MRNQLLVLKSLHWYNMSNINWWKKNYKKWIYFYDKDSCIKLGPYCARIGIHCRRHEVIKTINRCVCLMCNKYRCFLLHIINIDKLNEMYVSIGHVLSLCYMDKSIKCICIDCLQIWRFNISIWIGSIWEVNYVQFRIQCTTVYVSFLTGHIDANVYFNHF